jgi:hypothetical protein
LQLTQKSEWATYGASKTTGEKAAWEFMDEHKPGFVLNTVLPSCNFGSALHESHTSASTSKFLTQLWSGEAGMLPYLPPRKFSLTAGTANKVDLCI